MAMTNNFGFYTGSQLCYLPLQPKNYLLYLNAWHIVMLSLNAAGKIIFITPGREKLLASVH